MSPGRGGAAPTWRRWTPPPAGLTAWRGAERQRLSRLTGLRGALLVVMAGVLAGIATAAMGQLVATRPALFVALPLLLAVAFALCLWPKALVVALLAARAAADPVLQGTQIGGASGLGGVLNLAVIVLAVLMVLAQPQRLPRAAWWAWGPFLLVQILGLSYSPDLFGSARLVAAQCATFAIFVLAYYLVDDLPSFVRMMKLVLVSSLPVVALTFAGVAGGESFYAADDLAARPNRYAGPMPHPNVLAFYMVLTLGVALYLWKRVGVQQRPWRHVVYGALLLSYVCVLLATQTRSAWVAAAVLFLLYGLFVERRFLVYLVAVPLLALAFVPELRERLLDLLQGNEAVQYAKLNSFAWRRLLWESGLRWMSPWQLPTGYGYNAFVVHSVDFFPLAGNLHWGAHSVFVQLLFDLGVVGLGCYLWLFWRAWRLTAPLRRTHALLWIVCTAELAAYLVISASDNMLAYLVFNWYFWFVIGAACALALRLHAAVPPGPARSGRA